MWKKAVVAHFKTLHKYLLQDTKEALQTSVSDWKSKSRPPEYDAGTLHLSMAMPSLRFINDMWNNPECLSSTEKSIGAP
jgi:hypothetical protein